MNDHQKLMRCLEGHQKLMTLNLTLFYDVHLFSWIFFSAFTYLLCINRGLSPIFKEQGVSISPITGLSFLHTISYTGCFFVSIFSLKIRKPSRFWSQPRLNYPFSTYRLSPRSGASQAAWSGAQKHFSSKHYSWYVSFCSSVSLFMNIGMWSSISSSS